MTDIEYEQILKQLRYLKSLIDQGYRYVARSESGVLTVFKKKPYKEINFWYCGFYGIKYEKDIDRGIFDEINWRDEVPHSIQSIYRLLIKEHDISNEDIDNA